MVEDVDDKMLDLVLLEGLECQSSLAANLYNKKQAYEDRDEEDEEEDESELEELELDGSED